MFFSVIFIIIIIKISNVTIIILMGVSRGEVIWVVTKELVDVVVVVFPNRNYCEVGSQ